MSVGITAGIVSVIVIFVAIALYFQAIIKIPSNWTKLNDGAIKQNSGKGDIFSKSELSKYDGSENSPGLYLSFMGSVYDVQAGKRFYLPGNGYGFFSAKDGTRAFVTGDFTEKGLIEDVDDFTPDQIGELYNWIKLYEDDYVNVGKLHGYYYNSDGQETDVWNKIRAKKKTFEEQKASKAAENKMFPPCNSEWTERGGSKVWCSNKSGGIERDWVGVPRKYFKPGVAHPACVCLKNIGLNSYGKFSNDRGDLDNPNFKLYDNCDASSVICSIIKL